MREGFCLRFYQICKQLLVKTLIFTLLILPIHEHRVSSHFLVSLSLLQRFNVSTVKVVTFLVRFNPRYFIFFEAIVNVSASMILLYACCGGGIGNY